MPRRKALKEHMAESDKKEKGNVEEKRVKATVIRRRPAKAEPKAEVIEAVPETKAVPEIKAAAPPPAPPEEPVVKVKVKESADAGKRPLKKGAKAPAEGAKKGARTKTRVVEAEDIEADFEAELEPEATEESEAAHIAEPLPSVILPPAIVPPEGETRPAETQAAGAAVEAKPGDKQVRREVTVFQKEPELKKFYTARRPIKKGKGYHPKDFRASRTGTAQLQTRPSKKTELTVPKAAKRVIRIIGAISVAELSQRLGVKAGEIIKKLMSRGIMATVNQFVDMDAAGLVAADYGYEVESGEVMEASLIGQEEGIAGEGLLEPRAPVVTVMGHVDHGKTSLLDAIRKTNVVSNEAGGITQHIGAYHVHLEKGDITFLDTPGHEAFTAMRARGAKATDIVILVVAADDGVMPQTVEAINHAKAANVPIIVAINKIDLPQVDPSRIKNELAKYSLVPEEWGGETIFIEVSAKKGIKIKELLEMILLQAEVLELKADRLSPAKGLIVESKLDKGRGPVATVLIQNGTLNVGDAFVTGVHYGRVRAMISDWGQRIDEAGPSMPIEILGASGVPQAGDVFIAVKDEATAKQIAAIRQAKAAEKEIIKTAKVSLDDLYEKIRKGEVKELNLIIKADVQGSIEAIKETLSKIGGESVKLKTIHSAVGGINEGDCMLAAASNAIIIGFNVRPESKAHVLAEKEKLDIRLYNVIYNLADDIKNAMEGMLAPIVREEVVGRAEVRDVFRITKVGNVAGCYVVDGKALRGARARLIRENVVIYDGKLSSLKRFKDDVKEVSSGYECGMTIEGYSDIKQGDVLELYTQKEEAARL